MGSGNLDIEEIAVINGEMMEEGIRGYFHENPVIKTQH